MIAEYTFFSSINETIPKTDHILHHKKKTLNILIEITQIYTQTKIKLNYKSITTDSRKIAQNIEIKQHTYK